MTQFDGQLEFQVSSHLTNLFKFSLEGPIYIFPSFVVEPFL